MKKKFEKKKSDQFAEFSVWTLSPLCLQKRGGPVVGVTKMYRKPLKFVGKVGISKIRKKKETISV